MFSSGPKQEPSSDDTGWTSATDFSLPDKTSVFTYNPAAGDIVSQSGDFPQPTDVEAPEKM